MNRRNLRSVLTFAAIALPGTLIAVTGYLQPLAGGSVPRGAEQIRLPATDTVSLCPGPLQVAEGSEPGGEELQAAAVPPVTVRAGSALTQAPDSTQLAAGVASQGLDGAEGFTVGPSAGFVSGSDVEAAPVRITGVAEGENPALVTAVQTTGAAEGDWAGLAALTCTRPVPRASFATTGASATDDVRLLLTNPGQATVSVQTAATGAHGPIDIGGDSTVSLTPGEQRVIQLGALAHDQPEVGVSVSADGGLIGAALQHTRRSGLQAGGIELSGPLAGPERRIRIPVAAAGTAQLRVRNPHRQPVSIDVAAAGVDGPVDLARSGTSVPAEGTITLDLGEIPASVLDVTADQPVHGAVEVTGSPEAADDFAVFPSVEALNTRQLLMLPEGAQSRLLFAPGEGTLGLVGLSADGSAGSQHPVDLSPDRATEVAPAELLGGDIAGVIIETPPEVEAYAAGAARLDGGISGLQVPEAPTGIGYRSIRLSD